MSVTSDRIIRAIFSGDVTSNKGYSAGTNDDSPGEIEIVTLASGSNTITPPTGGTTAKACTIIPPAANAILITLKGVTGDTGIVLHLTDPTSIAINDPTETFDLTAAAEIEGVRLIWT